MFAVKDPDPIVDREADSLIKPHPTTIWPERIDYDIRLILDGEKSKSGNKFVYECGHARRVDYRIDELDDGRFRYQSSLYVKSSVKLLDSSENLKNFTDRVSEIDYIFDPSTGEIEILKSKSLASGRNPNLVDDRFFSGNYHAHEKLGREVYFIALSSVAEYSFREARNE